MNIGVVVVLYHPSEENLEGIKKYLPFFQKAVLVDNSPEPLPNQEWSEKVHYIFLNGNYGIGTALNRGAHFLLEQGMDAFITMDQDSQLDEKMLSVYCRVADAYKQTARIGCLSPQYLTPRHQIKETEGIDEILWTMQSGTLFFRDAFLQAGDFREDYFIDGVDYEYSLRLKKMEYRVLRCNEAVLVHEPATTCEFKLKNWVLFRYGIASPERYYYQIRNMICIGIEYHSFRSFLVAGVKIGKIILLFPQKKKYFKRAIQGVWDGIRQKTGAL